MNRRNVRLTLEDTNMSAILKLSEEIPGAIKVCAEILNKGGDIDPDSALGGLGTLLLLDTFGIYGTRIWILYKYVCKQDLTKTIAILRAVQMGIINEDKLQYAIDNHGKGINVDDLYKKVRQKLPRFSDSLVIVSGIESMSTVREP